MMAIPTTEMSVAIMLAIHSIGNVLLMLHVIFPLLRKDALTMSHIDPSIIIDTAIPVPNLVILVTCCLGWNAILAILNHVLRNESSTDSAKSSLKFILNTLQLIGTSTILFHMLLILLGLHPTYLPKQTVLASFYVALNSIFPTVILLGEDIGESRCLMKQNQKEVAMKEGITRIAPVWIYLTGPWVNENQQRRKGESQQYRNLRIQQLHQCATFGASVGMIITAILRILDHGLQIQRHPMPILLGFTWGRCGGVLIGIISLAFCKKS
eukprot:CCRYP_011793-RA/>CCRYP_011793-RA protein AED:0.04 eAED:0.04 QI:67/1/1/1/1/1/2/919/267